MKWTIALCTTLGLLSSGPMAQQPADSSVVSTTPQPARDTIEPLSRARVDSTPARDTVQPVPRVQFVATPARDTLPPATHPGSAPPVRVFHETPRPVKAETVARPKYDRSWQLALDFADISDTSLNKRHFNQSEDQTTLCCLDVAWLPLVSSQGWIQAGAFGNLGGWHQYMADYSNATVVDFSVGPTLLGIVPLWSRWKGWARVDLGVSNLVVDHHTTGMDWGWAGAVRTGLAFPMGNALGFFGGGVDFRDYWHLDVENVPVLNLFVGVWI